MTGTTHVFGAGLAGLAAAMRLADAGRTVVLHEASGQAGGRCRSFHDPVLGCLIDNGNHLLLGANARALAFLDMLGTRGGLIETSPAAFPFLDLRTGESWTVRPNAGLLPWWVFAAGRRVPGSSARAHLASVRLLAAPAGASVAECLDAGDPLFDRLWKPLAVSALNVDAHRGAARLMRTVLLRSLLRGEAACRPMIARDGLGPCFIDPALARLERAGVQVRFHSRLRGIAFAGNRAAGLDLPDGTVGLGPEDAVVLAVPPGTAASLLPGLVVPPEGPAIVNVHFRLDRPPRLPGGLALLGLIGGTAEWLFARGDVLSATVSAADALAAEPAPVVASRVWRDAAAALGTPEDPLPAFRVVKEKRATFLQTPETLASRPGPRTRWSNLFLAGDWTDTGLPATIEGAILSGERAAACLD
ncbi:hydroxysqualene dehydroxylase HpnE [Arenibaculum sp.]|jgi:squalene-associated FAD-dependent desaturase|uniref:hydroxysqualene dehydroxylase HpnE n=1 Tax=Arenibaculum sp. TaxID=2865862 RepID=UPI002E1536CA|nr:hydroxysqualene dehydroxylase HpnE [Arenibaculum sp.]